MSEQIGWGILSTAGIADAFVKDLAVGGMTCVAVGSRTQESADEFGERHGIPHRHAGYEALVADPDVDIVYVATPHPFHAEGALLALAAGKHVLVEKPFTLNADQARAVTALAAEKGLLALEAMWTRFLPHMVRLHEIIEAGTLGDVRVVVAGHDQDLPKDPEHRLNNPHLGGGALLDLGIYPVSFAVDILGAPASVSAVACFTDTGVDRQTSMLFEHEDGRQSLLHAALDMRGPNTASVLGTLGRVEIDAVWYQGTSFTVYDSVGEAVERYETAIQGRGMQFQALEAERLIRAGETASPRLSPAETVLIMDVLDDVRRRIGLTYPAEVSA